VLAKLQEGAQLQHGMNLQDAQRFIYEGKSHENKEYCQFRTRWICDLFSG
jgi:hypothetical protein